MPLAAARTGGRSECLLRECRRCGPAAGMGPLRFQSDFVARLPACVKVSIAWRAAPSRNLDMARYDRVVCNFPSILAGYEALGWKPAFLSPAHDPEMDAYAANENRPFDVV